MEYFRWGGDFPESSSSVWNPASAERKGEGGKNEFALALISIAFQSCKVHFQSSLVDSKNVADEVFFHSMMVGMELWMS